MAEQPTPQDVVEIDVDEAARLLRDHSADVINVLPRVSHVNGHIPGTTSIPLDQLAQQAPVRWPDAGRRILIYCAGFT